jgi:thiol-disulfide isomerase/thioredoxin
MTRYLMLVPAALIICSLLLTSSAWAEGGDQPAIPAPETLKVGEKAPHFVLKTLNPAACGQTMLSSKQHLGGDAKAPVKGMVISFLSVHCKPCMKELPELSEWYLKNREAGLGVVAIDIDREAEEIAQAAKLAVEKGVKFPVVSDRFNLLSRRYKVGELPYLLLVNGDGIVIWVKTGYEEGIFAELDKMVAPLLAPPEETK